MKVFLIFLLIFGAVGLGSDLDRILGWRTGAGEAPGTSGVRVGINISSKFWKLLRETRGDGGEFWALGC